MQPAFFPAARRKFRASAERIPSAASWDRPSSMLGMNTSWTSTYGRSSMESERNTPLAWTGIVHQMADEDEDEEEDDAEERGVALCNQAVLLTCLHLSRQIAMGKVATFAWTDLVESDAIQGTNRVMRGYAKHIKAISGDPDFLVRPVADPSKATMQNRLQKARLAAGVDPYVAVFYNGQGIQEAPTEAGELWCFDKSFEDCLQEDQGPSEYIPVLLFDVMTWAGSSTCFVWDCNGAGRLVKAAMSEASEIDKQLSAAAETNTAIAQVHPAVYSKRQIHFAACGANETIPRIEGTSDDIFTVCLMYPLRCAFFWHNTETRLPLPPEYGDSLRRSPEFMEQLWKGLSDGLRERLATEFRAVLHTIAWQTLEGPEYQLLFGNSDSLVAKLSGGFLVAQRVFSTKNVHPQSMPYIPIVTHHPIWEDWDMLMDNFFTQLPDLATIKAGTAWEEDLEMIPYLEEFMDALAACEQGHEEVKLPHRASNMPNSLMRLPLIRQAALMPDLRKKACLALDYVLKNQSDRGLVLAIQGGALDTATQLLEAADPTITPELVSIWTTLFRNETCIATLIADGRTAERLTSVPAVRFFLETLEKEVSEEGVFCRKAVVQLGVVLATIANHVAGRQAPRFKARTLRLGSLMLSKDDNLVCRWGGLMVAEVLESIKTTSAGIEELKAIVQEQLKAMTSSPKIEHRAVAIYALARWIETDRVCDILELRPALELCALIRPQSSTDGAYLVRREIAKLLQRVLLSGGRWTQLALWSHLTARAKEECPGEATKTSAVIESVYATLQLDLDQRGLLQELQAVIETFDTLRVDSNHKVAQMVEGYLSDMHDDLKAYFPEEYDEIMLDAGGPRHNGTVWTPTLVMIIQAAGFEVAAQWERANDKVPLRYKFNDLVEKSKRLLDTYLQQEDVPERGLEQLAMKSDSHQDRGYISRLRDLEDASWVASQQEGLPWGWRMRDISSEDPWTTVRFHSFLSPVLSCNNSDELIMWDWDMPEVKTTLKIRVPPGAIVTSARFVNELYDRHVLLAEINTGDIHVLSSTPGDRRQFKTISSFLAVKLDKTMLRNRRDPTASSVVTDWWRRGAKLVVGGASDVVNIWDCPSERSAEIMRTGSEVPLTTLMTESKDGDVLVGGFADGHVKLWDVRESKPAPVMSYLADQPLTTSGNVQSGNLIVKLGVRLHETKYITSACANGLLNMHDLRRLDRPASSTLAHPSGMACASYQSLSGLMTTISRLNPPVVPAASVEDTMQDLSLEARPRANWGLYRSTGSGVIPVSREQITFEPQAAEVVEHFRPYTVIHGLRPFLSVGYGRTSYLRGAGVGQGKVADSGSYRFLKEQEKNKFSGL